MPTLDHINLHFVVSNPSLYKMTDLTSYQDTLAALDPCALAAAAFGGST